MRGTRAPQAARREVEYPRLWNANLRTDLTLTATATRIAAREAAGAAQPSAAAPVFTYSLSRGLFAGVSLEGSGVSTILESETTVLACADGAVRVANLSIRQLAAAAAEPCFGIELRGKTLVEQCQLTARCVVKNSAGVLARGAAAHARPTCVRGCSGLAW